MDNVRHVHKPVILENGKSDGSNRVVYYNSKDQKKETILCKGVETALPNAFSQLVQRGHTNLSALELQECIWENTGHIKTSPSVHDAEKLERADRLIDHFSHADSDGGEKITPKEQYKMMELWAQWYGNNVEE